MVVHIPTEETGVGKIKVRHNFLNRQVGVQEIVANVAHDVLRNPLKRRAPRHSLAHFGEVLWRHTQRGGIEIKEARAWLRIFEQSEEVHHDSFAPAQRLGALRIALNKEVDNLAEEALGELSDDFAGVGRVHHLEPLAEDVAIKRQALTRSLGERH